MIYLMIQGGCGNQFFQYAFARTIQKKTGQQLSIDWRYIEGTSNLWNGGENALQYFNITDICKEKPDNIIQFRLLDVLWRFMYKFHFEFYQKKTYYLYKFFSKIFNPCGLYLWDSCYRKFTIAKTQNIVIKGYYESSQYFKEIDDMIRREFTVKDEYPTLNPEMLQAIQTTNSVCVTIKRRDINNDAIKDVYEYNIDYFIRAIRYMSDLEKNLVFFVFSDDIQWCRDRLPVLMPDIQFQYESGTDPIYEKMRLMSSCKHFIIHNSTFSWWAQHLSSNENKIVIAPAKWMNRDDQPIDIYEQGWIYETSDGRFLKEHL